VKQEQQTSAEPHPEGTEDLRSIRIFRTKLKIHIPWKKTARNSDNHARKWYQ